ncbi:Hypothetical predicted protein [Marmota monax]|uniref:Far11/STRP N-terminal domain-containing protein n=1 Tax=Marmota monax TaxID=9995 RepID=A0A5E4BK37_MARMO|nr:Hypothetical predicted protein [Marmota monax]
MSKAAFSTAAASWQEEDRFDVQGKEWLELEEDAQKTYVMGLLDRLEVVSRERRLKVARAVLYLAQGTFGECDSEVDVLHWSRYNCFLLYQMGTFSAFLELLHMEIDNSQACSSAIRKPAVSIADSTELRVLLSVMYLMVENIRLERETDPYGWRTARETFRTELSFSMHNEEPFALLLFSMVTKFCSGLAPHFPIKKVLLLLWKVVMFTLGGFEHLQALKIKKRAELGLPPLAEDSIQVVKSMRAASPPSYTLDLGESQLAPPPSKLRGRRGSRRQLLTKQDSLDIYNERDLFKTEDPATEDEEESAGDGERTLDGELDLLEQDPLVPPPPSQGPLSAERVAFPKGLPWAPKVRDTDTLVGLPRPIHESVKTLKQQLLTKQDSLDIYNERDLFKTEDPATEDEEESAGDGERTLDGELDLLEQDPLVPPPPSQGPLSAERVAFPKGLPWAPKVRDTDTLVGLPRPIHESVKTLKQVTRVGSQSSGIGSHQGPLTFKGPRLGRNVLHIYVGVSTDYGVTIPYTHAWPSRLSGQWSRGKILFLASLSTLFEGKCLGICCSTKHKYVSIADVQIKNEEELEKCPMSLIALLKILLAAAPTSKAKTDSINILADVLPEEMP